MKTVLSTLAALTVSCFAAADTITVCLGGSCDYTDIQQAVNAASAGDVISIAAGSYYPSAQINTLGKAITLRGATNPDTGVATTFVNGQALRRLFICQNNESASTRFENLIIELGSATLGGGMFIQAGSHPTIVNCAFVTNWAGSAGGAVYCAILTSPTFIDCVFVNNAAYELGGGAVYTTATTGYPSAPRFLGCTFINNEAILGYGGGMLVSGSHPELIDCAFEWNLAAVSGGGLATGDGGETRLEASMVCNNMPNQIYGAWDDDGDNCVNAETCDADDDGTSDCLDECPDDPDKTEPGECGCGVSDGDSDGDGTADCNDPCPNWPGDCSEDGMTIYVEPGEAIDVAVNAVPAGGIVEIEAGVYYLEAIINPLGKAMTIRGAVDGEGGPATIIDRESNGRIAKCVSGEGTDTSFVNIIFTGGYTASGEGGGLRCINASPTVSNCVFIANTAVFGGGMYVETGSPVVLDCTFLGNAATNDGGGMYAYLSSSPTLVNCVFENNTAVDDAGGLFNREATSTLIDCVFDGNDAGDIGGAVRNAASSPTLTGCTLQGNVAAGDGGGGMWSSNGSLPVLTNTTVCGNTPDQISGDWTDNGGNTVAEKCPDAVITVCSSGCDYTSINAAIDAASNGDVIQLSAETYYEGEEINTDGKAITLSGAVDKSGVALSILDGGGSHRVLSCQSGEIADTVFENMVIRNGSANSGGGLLCSDNSSPVLINCTFDGNSAVNSGGGMYNSSSSPTLTDCTFMNNWALIQGGGMRNVSSNPFLTNCIFTGNSADYGGGMVNENSSPTLTDTTVCGNTSDQISGDWTDKGGNCVQESCNDCGLVDCPSDFNGDGQVNGGDLGVFLIEWGECAGCAADLNGDGYVDGGDLGAFLIAWGPCP